MSTRLPRECDAFASSVVAMRLHRYACTVAPKHRAWRTDFENGAAAWVRRGSYAYIVILRYTTIFCETEPKHPSLKQPTRLYLSISARRMRYTHSPANSIYIALLAPRRPSIRKVISGPKSGTLKIPPIRPRFYSPSLHRTPHSVITLQHRHRRRTAHFLPPPRPA